MTRAVSESPARLLIVDDDATYRRVLEDLLRGAGHVVDSAADGQEALEKVRNGRPEVVLTDSVMPRMDGPTLCRLLKSHELFRSTYVIMLSARGEVEAKVAGLDLGADDYLVKPVDSTELMARVRSGLRLQRALSELSRKNELLERLALTDPLTGLANRRAFSGSMEAELARARRSGKAVGLLFLDLDRFKAINDGHGHAVGDEVLIAVADLLRRHGRRGDLTARMGGEEFAVLLPETENSNSMLVAERIRKAVEAEPVGRTVPLTVTVSIGVAVTETGKPETPEALLARADAALYKAKGAGRNRVEAAPPPETQEPAAP